MGRFATLARHRLAALWRQPLTLAALFVLPPLVVELYGVALASFPRLPTLSADPATVGRTTGTLFAVAFLAGLVGLFQVVGARRGDARAAVAGVPRGELLAARLATTAAVAVCGAGVALAVLAARVRVGAPVVAFGALVLAALEYGLLGVVVGTALPRELEGSVALVFLADADNALASGLFPIEATLSLPAVGGVAVTDLVPLYHPQRLFAAAVLDGDLATAHLAPALGWVAGLLAVAAVVSVRGADPAAEGVVA